MNTIRTTNGAIEYRCPVCKNWYTWDGNFGGLMLIEAEGQPFVCNACHDEGMRLNDAAMARFDAQNAPIWEAAREHWPEIAERPAIYWMPADAPAFEIEVRHLDTGQVEREWLEAVEVGDFRMAYSPASRSLAVWRGDASDRPGPLTTNTSIWTVDSSGLTVTLEPGTTIVGLGDPADRPSFTFDGESCQ